ncbi:MAG: type II secretion system major pseudopilin GspG [Sphingomonas sp.]
MGPRFREGDEKGFTLVELMVVIVIIGLLAAIVTFNVLPMGDKARVEKARSDISTIDQALEMYKLQNLHYPSTSEGLQALVRPSGSADSSRYQAGGYLRKLPADPWGRPYQYASPGQHGEADVWSWGADGKQGGEGVDADIGSWQ